MKVHVLQNAHIYTGDPGRPWAHTLAIAADRIVALEQEAARWEDVPGAVVTDMEGVTIIPGLIDSHLHLMWYALAQNELALRDLTREELLQQVAEKASEVPPGTWIQGRNWDQNLWADSRFPTAAELDRVAPHHPVVLTAKSAHAVVANSMALHAAGISAGTPNPIGGELGRRADGSPNGMLFEHAMQLVLAAVPEPTLDEVIAALRGAQEQLLAVGLTGIHDMDGTPAFTAFQALHREHALRVRVVKYVWQDALADTLAAGLRSGRGDDWLRFGGLKLFADGALGARTAALCAPYTGEPDNTGILTLEPEELQDIAQRAVAGGVALAIHAIGDRANRMVLDALEKVRPLDQALRHRIEHVQLIDPADQPCLAELGIVAAMQPLHAPHDQFMAERYW
ncbi:MAG: amidohydrolase, partial [Chloroflexota bacterium]|nr:amidohydrolase [Chloroflexota bacterium]